MNEKEKAKALAESIDALLRGEERAAPVAPDEEVQDLTELARSLESVEFPLSPTQQAALERLLQKHRTHIAQWRAVRNKSEIAAAREVIMDTKATHELDPAPTRSRPRWLVPVAAVSGGLAILLILALVIALGTGLAWRTIRRAHQPPEQTPAAISGGNIGEDLSPLSSPTAQSKSTATVPPLPTATREAEVAQNPTPGTDTEPRHTVYLPFSVQPLSPQSAMLQDLQGVVEVQADGDTWTQASERQILKAGQRIRTGALSSARLSFYEGSTAHLGPDTEVSIEVLDANPGDKARIIELMQWAGDTDHDVAKATSTNARYEVRTPSGVGEAKGTSFHVVVRPTVLAQFIVNEGAVAVTNVNVTVIVVAGQLTTIPVDQAPSEPYFRVTGEGEVTAIGTTWTIAEQTFATDETTIVVGNPQVGDWVFVEGHLLPDGTKVADRIVLLRRSLADRFSITGRVEAIGDTAWTVAGQTIAVDGETVIDEGIASEDLVHVEGVIQPDGTLLAQEIHLIEELPGLPFHFVGIVQEIGTETWTISGIAVTVGADTVIAEGLVTTDLVEVEGWILESGTWLARSIERAEEVERKFEFIGSVETIAPWVVSGISFETREWTEIEPGIEVGNQVKVTGQILEDGTWVATEIELFDEEQALQFEFVGRVETIAPWVVSGVTLAVDDETEIQGEIVVGMLVKVEGRILEDGTWLATEIKPATTIVLGPGCMSLTALVVGVNTNALVLSNGTTIALGDDIIVEGQLVTNSVIMLYVCVDEDGTMHVVHIIVLYLLEPEPIIIVPNPPLVPAPETNEMVVVCHKPNSKNPHTLTIPRSALKAHLGHGDTLGLCR